MTADLNASQSSAQSRRTWVSWYTRIPLYARILIALALGVLVGKLLGPRADFFKPGSDLILQALRLLATPLIFISIVHALMKTSVSGRTGARLLFFLVTNTTAAILIGLLIANIFQPGRWMHLPAAKERPDAAAFDPLHTLLNKIPTNFVDPFISNDILSVIILALALGVSLRICRTRQEARNDSGHQIVEALLETAFQSVMVMLHWIFELVPLAVFAVVARTVGTVGIHPLLAMGFFVLAVVLGLALQAAFYLARLRAGSWVRPARFLRGASDALVMAFSTASSTATLPITYAAVKERIGVREESAGLGIMVGGAFSHDGAALYEAVAALFVGQALGQHLGLGQQIVVVLMSMLAAFGAAGIPGAGLVTMVAVFSAVRLPTEYIALLLPLDWFLDRCRTAINVMGDMAVTCLLDGKHCPDEKFPDETGTRNVPQDQSCTGGDASPVAMPNVQALSELAVK